MELDLIDTLDKLNKSWYLPTLQRDFVWLKNDKDKKIEKLFDSLMIGYPIGQIVIWKVPDVEEIKSMKVYQFLNHYEKDGNNENGSLSINSEHIDYLVLDGQQRLTSIFIACNPNGYYKIKNETKYFYINLLYESDNEAVNDITYQFEFLTEEEALQIDSDHIWFKVSDLIYNRSYSDSVRFSRDIARKLSSQLPTDYQSDEITDKMMDVLQLLWKNVREKKINCEEARNKSIDSMLEIFVRLNDGGIPLEKSDLLLSFMESREDLFKPNGAREVISKFVKETINNRGDAPEDKVEISNDLVLKASLMLSDLDIRYKVKNVIKDNLAKIDKNWKEISKTLEIVYRLIDRYHLTNKTMTSNNALLPIAYYLKLTKQNNPKFIDSKDDKEMKAKVMIIDWLSKALLTEVFSGSSDSTLSAYRESIKEKKCLELIGGKKITKEDIKNIVKKAEYKKKNTQLILFLITDVKYWENSQDHIFNQERFNSGELKQYKKLKNCIGNLQLLSQPINSSKNDSNIEDWITNLSQEAKDANLYPPDISVVNQNFEQFVKEREKLIVNKLCEKLGIQD